MDEQLDFSSEKLERLGEAVEGLTIALSGGANNAYWKTLLNEMILAASDRNRELFKRLAISREFFGGSGALWELQLDTAAENQAFATYFAKFIDALLAIGISHPRIDQIRSSS